MSGRLLPLSPVLTCLVLTSLLAFPGACSRGAETGPEPIAYDRDNCERCQMLISDIRYAAEVRLPGERHVHKFDDLGDALTWLAERPPTPPPPTPPPPTSASVSASALDTQPEIWVRDADRDEWLEARAAYYSHGAKTPMGFGFAAHAQPGPGRIDLERVRAAVTQIVKERRHGQ